MTPRISGIETVLRSRALLAFTGKYHGVGNRMRAVLGARVLARAEDRAFVYTWPTGRHFGVRLDRLWVFDAPVVPATISRMLAPQFPYRDNELRWLDNDVRRQRLWQIRTPHAIVLPPECPPWETELRGLSPTQEITERIRAAFDMGPGRPYVGVMIRTHRNAHALTLQHSPIEWYIARMRQIRDIWPDVPFYISADTRDAYTTVTRTITDCFGKPDKGDYNSEKALIGSVVDLYLLASSTHLIGPYFSSFPELARLLAGPQLRLETSLSAPDNILDNVHDLSVARNPIRPFDRQAIG